MQLVREIGDPIEVEVPPIARESPVPNIGDAPVRHGFDVDDEIDACAISAVRLTAAEDHLPPPV